MIFCPNCNNKFTIVRNDDSQSKLTPVPAPVAPASSSDEVSESVVVTTEERNPVSSLFIFKCSNCGFSENIKPKTMVLSRTSDLVNKEYTDKTKYKDMVNDETLPRTRNYICPNEACLSHKDHTKREAVWFKPDIQKYGILYICTSCNKMW